MAEALLARPHGVPLSQMGGLPSPIGPLYSAKPVPVKKAPAPSVNLIPELGQVLRPQAAARWQMPYLAAITPTYVESVIRGALYGNHIQAWQLYDLMWDTDPEIQACIGEYVDDVLNKKFLFEPWHEEDEEPSDLALEKLKLVAAACNAMRPDMASDENDLRGTVKDLLAARFHGQSFLAIDWFDTYGDGGLYQRQIPNLGLITCPRATYWVHPMCYALDQNGRWGLSIQRDQVRSNSIGQKKFGNPAILTAEPMSWSAINRQPGGVVGDFPTDQFLLGIFKSKTGTSLAGSCLRSLAWWWVASNFCGDYLLNLAQLFGIPFRKAKYGASTPEPAKAEIRQMLQACGSTGYILLPDSADVEFMDTGGSAGQSPQAFLFHFADSQKRKVILHQTMTGGQHDSMGKGGGKAFGEVESDTKGDCIQAGANYAASVINLQLIPSILKLNYGDDGDLEAPSVKLVDSEVGGLDDAQRDQVLSAIMDMPTTYLRRKYGVPKIGPNDEIAGVDEGTGAAQMKSTEKAQKAALAAQPKPEPKNENSTDPNAEEQDGTGTEARNLSPDAKAAIAAARHGQPGSPATLQGAGTAENTDSKSRAILSSELNARVTGPPIPEHGFPGSRAAIAHDAAMALHETVEPVLKRIEAIAQVDDEDTRRKLTQKLLKDLPQIAAALVHDDSLAKAITPELVKEFVAGLKTKPKE